MEDEIGGGYWGSLVILGEKWKGYSRWEVIVLGESGVWDIGVWLEGDRFCEFFEVN